MNFIIIAGEVTLRPVRIKTESGKVRCRFSVSAESHDGSAPQLFRCIASDCHVAMLKEASDQGYKVWVTGVSRGRVIHAASVTTNEDHWDMEVV